MIKKSIVAISLGLALTSVSGIAMADIKADLANGLPLEEVLANAQKEGLSLADAVAQIVSQSPALAEAAVSAAVTAAPSQAAAITSAAVKAAPKAAAKIVAAATQAAPGAAPEIAAAATQAAPEAAPGIAAAAAAVVEFAALQPSRLVISGPTTTGGAETAIESASKAAQ